MRIAAVSFAISFKTNNAVIPVEKLLGENLSATLYFGDITAAFDDCGTVGEVEFDSGNGATVGEVVGTNVDVIHDNIDETGVA